MELFKRYLEMMGVNPSAATEKIVNKKEPAPENKKKKKKEPEKKFKDVLKKQIDKKDAS
jgi:hypothetical protein